jgi:DNA-binding LytR/AlgR family response regulator
MINCIAVDDEKLVLDLLVDNIRQVPFLHLVGRCKNAMEAAEIIHSQPIDLIFLDIQMPGLNGLQFVANLKNPPMIIFVTAYKEYALEGFNLDAIDYLLKPVSFERFFKACTKAQELYNLKQKPAKKEEQPGYFFVYVEYNQVKITIADIMYIEAMKDYIKIFVRNTTKPIITKMTMKAIEEKMTDYDFIRIHKSFLVAANAVTAIKRDILCIGTIELPISETFKPNLSALLSR